MPITLASIKRKLDGKIGENLTVVAQAGRKKETYPAIFVVDLDQNENAFERVSYSYADLLTKSIKITFEGEEKAS